MSAAAGPVGTACAAYYAIVGAELIDERPAQVERRAARRPEGDFERMAANVMVVSFAADVYLQDDGSRPRLGPEGMEFIHRWELVVGVV
jgi:hypothetical protein